MTASTNPPKTGFHAAPEKLLDLLKSERDHHFSHPSMVTNKAFFALAAALGSFGIAAILKGSALSRDFMIAGIVPLVTGGVIVLFGLLEHRRAHEGVRRQLETMIIDLVTRNLSPAAVDDLLPKVREVVCTEPDSRRGFHHHDAKILVGLLVAFAAPLVWSLGGN